MLLRLKFLNFILLFLALTFSYQILLANAFLLHICHRHLSFLIYVISLPLFLESFLSSLLIIQEQNLRTLSYILHNHMILFPFFLIFLFSFPLFFLLLFLPSFYYAPIVLLDLLAFSNLLMITNGVFFSPFRTLNLLGISLLIINIKGFYLAF